MRQILIVAAVGCAAAHSNLIYPKPRNAIDSLLPEWSCGKSPYVWQPCTPRPAPVEPRTRCFANVGFSLTS